MAGLTFEQIKGTTGVTTENSLLLRMSADEKTLKRVRKKLTARNTSVAWRLMKVKKQVKFWRSRYDSEIKTLGCAQDVTEEKLNRNLEELTVLEEKLKELYYQDDGDDILVPAGFWWLFEDLPENPHHNCEISPFFADDLRDYQREGLEELYKYKRATCVMGTGLGKSRMIASICVAAAKSGKRAFVVVPTDYLVGQIKETIEMYWDSVTAAGGKRKPKLGQDIFVCTVQSAMKYVDPYDVVIIDESHHSSASTWADLLANAERATHVYNFTATAFREDGMDLGIHAFGGPVVFERDVAWGIRNNWLMEPEVYCVDITLKKRNGEQSKVRSGALATSAYKWLVNRPFVFKCMQTFLSSALRKERRTILLFRTLPPAENFSKYCARSNIDFNVAHAKFKAPLHKFCKGESEILAATDKLISEGIDIPSADAMFQFTQNSSSLITLQAIGRILRPFPGKRRPIMIDICIRGYDQFERAARKRRNIYTQLTKDVKFLAYSM